VTDVIVSLLIDGQGSSASAVEVMFGSK